jgi:hypothetical protein
MKASELRIGNLFIEKYRHQIIKVETLNNRNIYFSGEFIGEWQAEPIPLNEEWLLKFGFEWCNEAAGYFDNLHAVYLMYPNVQFHPFCTNDKDCWIELQYVHQLQNLCFALTGKELEIKA